MPSEKTLLTNATVATMQADGEPYGLIQDGAVLVEDDRISWVGPASEAPQAPACWYAQGTQHVEHRAVLARLLRNTGHRLQ